MSFHALQVSLEKIYYTFAQEPDILFCARPKAKAFAFVGERLENLESREILCAPRPNILTVLAGARNKTLTERIRYLYKNITDRLLVATSQSIKDHREQMLHLDTSQLVLIRVPIVH